MLHGGMRHAGTRRPDRAATPDLLTHGGCAQRRPPKRRSSAVLTPHKIVHCPRKSVPGGDSVRKGGRRGPGRPRPSGRLVRKQHDAVRRTHGLWGFRWLQRQLLRVQRGVAGDIYGDAPSFSAAQMECRTRSEDSDNSREAVPAYGLAERVVLERTAVYTSARVVRRARPRVLVGLCRPACLVVGNTCSRASPGVSASRSTRVILAARAKGDCP